MDGLRIVLAYLGVPLTPVLRRRLQRRLLPLASLTCLVLLAACDLGSSGIREESTKLGPRVVRLGEPVPKGGGSHKIGSPYRLNGKLYVPRAVENYDVTGTASWYGELFHGRRTANGEIYDMEALTAAHPTLPIPSYARVTNLRNGRSLVVRVNDRGPYARGRLIDLSWAVASLLQMRGSGTAPVRVQYLGPAPLDGDDRYERQVLARQPWAGPRVAFASSPAKAIRHARQPAEAQRYGGRYLRAKADADTAPGTRQAAFDSRMSAEPPIRRDAEGRAPALEAPRRVASNATAAARPAAFRQQRPDPARTASLYAPAPAPSGASEPQRIRGVFVEAGLFRQKETAERLASILSDLAPVSLRMETVGGTSVHRLRVGPFAGNDAAQSAVEQMRAAGLTGAYLQPAPGG